MCGLIHNKEIGSFFLAFIAWQTVTSNNYLDMLELYGMPQFPEGVLFQYDDAPSHYANNVREFLDTLSNRGG
ncbi:hypothetical protein TNCV_2315551 [Trichonephila clavipes]|nr:hypothetical protein TNCV_2315551 [Trichonephila clavipes]